MEKFYKLTVYVALEREATPAELQEIVACAVGSEDEITGCQVDFDQEVDSAPNFG